MKGVTLAPASLTATQNTMLHRGNVDFDTGQNIELCYDR
jgi:hypothetical protein